MRRIQRFALNTNSSPERESVGNSQKPPSPTQVVSTSQIPQESNIETEKQRRISRITNDTPVPPTKAKQDTTPPLTFKRSTTTMEGKINAILSKIFRIRISEEVHFIYFILINYIKGNKGDFFLALLSKEIQARGEPLMKEDDIDSILIERLSFLKGIELLKYLVQCFIIMCDERRKVLYYLLTHYVSIMMAHPN